MGTPCVMTGKITSDLTSIFFVDVIGCRLVQIRCNTFLRLPIDNFISKCIIQLRNNSIVFEELEVSIVDLTVANAVLLVMRSGASKTDIPILMKFSQRVHTSLKTYK